MSDSALLSVLTEAVQSVIPDAVVGSFSLTHDIVSRVPSAVRPTVAPYVGWSVFCFAVPITDEGLWVWHHHSEYRSLLANYVLLRAADHVADVLGPDVTTVDLPALTGQQLAMVEVGVLAGLGTRGWNNLLLHPLYGSLLQIHALLVGKPLPMAQVIDSDVCTHCSLCIEACPVNAIEADQFHPARCQAVVASPWKAKSRAVALTAATYVECRECIDACPISPPIERLFAWKR
jgi:ferredoxin